VNRQEFLGLEIYQQKVIDLKTLFSPQSGDGALVSQCIRPDHLDYTPSMHVFEDHVYCFGCGSYWWPDQFLVELGDRDLDTRPAPKQERSRSRYIPRSMVETYNRWLTTVYKDRLDFFFARGLRLEDSINPNLLGYDGTAYTIPVFGLDGEIAALRFRRDDTWQDPLVSETHKYWGLPGKNSVTLYSPRIPEHIDLRSDVIFLCEGELDALRLAQEGLIAWSLTNGCRAFGPEHVATFIGRKVKVVYDQDTPGRMASMKICQLLNCERVVWPEVLGKDVTEYLQRWSLQSFLTHL
jgi:hypothetical protein